MSRWKPKTGSVSRKEESFEGVGGRRRRDTEEFKAEAVSMHQDGHAASPVCARLGPSGVSLLYSWKR